MWFHVQSTYKNIGRGGSLKNNEDITVWLSILILTTSQTISAYSVSVYLFILLLLSSYFLGIFKHNYLLFLLLVISFTVTFFDFSTDPIVSWHGVKYSQLNKWLNKGTITNSYKRVSWRGHYPNNNKHTIKIFFTTQLFIFNTK